MSHLTKALVSAKPRRAMKSLILPAVAALALLPLAACNSQPQKPEVVDTNPDPMAAELANRAPVALPPAMSAEKTFRCKDNSLLYVTFYKGDTQLDVKTDKAATATRLTAPAAGSAYVAEGWSVSGTPAGVTATQPGKGSQSCKA